TLVEETHDPAIEGVDPLAQPAQLCGLVGARPRPPALSHRRRPGRPPPPPPPPPPPSPPPPPPPPRPPTLALTPAFRDRLERQQVPALALADHRRDGDVVQEVHRPERLASRGIGQVNLPERPLHAEQGIAQRDRRVGQPAGVDDRDVEVAAVQPIDQGALVVRLEEVDLETELGRARGDLGVDLVERVAAVDLGLARPEEVEVRALEDEDAGHAETLEPGAAASNEAAARSTTSAGTSARTTEPSAVGRTQRRAPSACFLSAARAPSTVSIG